MIEKGWNTTEVRVRYKDTDRMGVVYYGNYLTYFEVGRAEYMRALGYPYSELESNGTTLAIVETGARYHSNVGYDALLTVKAAITEIKGARLRFDYEIYSEENELMVTGFTVHACVNPDRKPVRIPEFLVKAVKTPSRKIK
jgi:acyl-CoA thioester hydrolase